MGVTQYTPRKKQAPIVPIRVERRAPPKVLNKPGTTEWVGTQKPTEQQNPEETMTLAAVKKQYLKDLNSIDKYEWKLANPNMSEADKAKEAAGLKALQKAKEASGGKLGPTEIAEYRKQQYKNSLDAAFKKSVQNVAGYNSSVKTYNQAIGHLTPEQNEAFVKRTLKKTQPKTVMA